MPTHTIGAAGTYTTWAAYCSYLRTVDEPIADSYVGQFLDMFEATTNGLGWFENGVGPGSPVVFGNNSSGSIRLEAASASRHPGYYDSTKAGIRNDSASTAVGAFIDYWSSNPSARNTHFKGLQFGRTSSGTSAAVVVGIRNFANTTAQPNGTVRFEGCVFRHDGTGVGSCIDTNNDSMQNCDVVIDNCVFIVNGAHGISIDVVCKSLRIYNCTILWIGSSSGGTPAGIRITQAPTGTYEIKNCYSASTNNIAQFRPFEVAGTPVFENNVSYGGNGSYQADDVTGAVNCVADTKPTSDYFDLTNVASGVAFRKTMSGGGTNRLDDVGQTLSSTYHTDIKGNIRTGSWSVGAEEFVNDTPPDISDVLPADDTEYLEGDTINFSATITDDGSVASISWESDLDGVLGTTSSFSRSDLSIGTHHITLTAIDNSANETTYEFDVVVKAVIVDVLADATAYAGQPTFVLGSSIQVGEGRTIEAYLWEQVSGTTATLDTPNDPTTNVSFGRSSSSGNAVFRLTVTVTGGYSSNDSATVAVVFGRQSVIYAVMQALTYSKGRALTIPHTDGGVQDYLYGFARAHFSDGRYETDTSNIPTPVIGSAFGLGSQSVAMGWALLYHELGIKDIKRHLLPLLRTFGLAQDSCAGGWSEDWSVVNGSIRPGTGSSNTFVANEFYYGTLLNDDGSSQGVWHALIEGARALWTHGDSEWEEIAGYVLRYYHDFLVACTTHTIVEADFPSYSPSLRPISVGDTPWSNGTFPGMWPPYKALGGFHHFQNWPDLTWPNDYNPHGAYGHRMPHNDYGVSGMLRALVALYRFAKELEANAEALPTYDSVNYTAANILARLESLVECVLDSFDLVGGVAAQVEPETLEAAWGRAKEPAAKLWAEADFWGGLAAVYRWCPDLNATLRGRIFTPGTPPTGALQEYADKLNEIPAANAPVANPGANGISVANRIWTPNTAYNTADVEVWANPPSYRAFRCTVAGTSGASAPTWNYTVGGTTTDGTVTWTCINKRVSNSAPLAVVKGIWRNTTAAHDPNIGNVVDGAVVAEDTPIFADDDGVIGATYHDANYCYEGGRDAYNNLCGAATAGAGQNWCSNYEAGAWDQMCYNPNTGDTSLYGHAVDPSSTITPATNETNLMMTLVGPLERHVLRGSATIWPASGSEALSAYNSQLSNGGWVADGAHFYPGLHLGYRLWGLYHLLTDYKDQFTATFDETVVDSDGDTVNDVDDFDPLDAEVVKAPSVSAPGTGVGRSVGLDYVRAHVHDGVGAKSSLAGNRRPSQSPD